MKKKSGSRLAGAIIVALVMLVAAAGCGNSQKDQARRLVDEALKDMDNSSTTLADLYELNSKIAGLGERFNNLEDTISEGKSLVRLVSEDIDQLEASLVVVQGIFTEVASFENAGDYATYATMAEDAVGTQLSAMQTNRLLASTLADLLSVVDLAENESQLQYYVDELERLSRQLDEEFIRAADLAGQADAFFKEKGL